MFQRPLCVALIVWIGIVFLFRSYWQKIPQEREGERLTMVCQVEEVIGLDDSITLVVKDVYAGDTHICKRMKLYQGSNQILFSNIRIGQILRIQGTVYSFVQPGNPGQFNEFQFNQEQGIQYKAFVDSVTIINQSYQRLQEVLRQFRLRLYQGLHLCCSERDAGILAAMVLGEKGVTDEEIRRLYQENGIAHILAISGLHISLIGAGIFFLLRKYVMPMTMAACVSSGILILYGMLTGFPISTVRAVIMMLCMLGARVVGRRYDAYCALALSAWIQLICQPLSLFQTGFLLSYGTVLGILVFTKEFQQAGIHSRGISSVMGALGVSLITMPILLSSYYELPLYSLLANLLLLPMLGVLLGAGLSGVMMSLCSIALGRFCMGTVHYILCLYETVCRILESLPNHQIILGNPSSWQILIYYGLLLLWVVLRQFRPQHKYWFVLALAIGVMGFSPQRGIQGLEITNLDVGQGDCTCIRTDRFTVLIDGGSSDVKEVGKYRISKFLKYYGICRIDVMFITHSDSDHTNGLLEIIKDKHHMGFSVGKIVLPRIGRKDDNYAKLERQCVQSGIPVTYMEKGNYFAIGDARFRCLHPYFTYDWMSENDYSLVLELQYGQFRGLFTGDLEKEGEKEIAASLSSVKYLKVGHHGSKGSSSEEFLETITPYISVYSAGRKNRYGHPAEETKERMKKIGAKEFCTINDGAVTVYTDGISTSVRTVAKAR